MAEVFDQDLARHCDIPVYCPDCGSDNLDWDDSIGFWVCCDCDYVFEKHCRYDFDDYDDR